MKPYVGTRWWSMRARRDFARLRFWHKIVNLPEDRLLKRVYNVFKATLKPDHSSWIFATRKILENLNLGHVWRSEETGVRKNGEPWLEPVYMQTRCARGKQVCKRKVNFGCTGA